MHYNVSVWAGAGENWAPWGTAHSHHRVPQVRDGATLILSKVGVSQQPEDSQQDLPGERESLPLARFLPAPGGRHGPRPPWKHGPPPTPPPLLPMGPMPQTWVGVPQCPLPTGHALLEEENRVWHLVRPTDEVDEGKSKRGSVKEKERTKAITEIYLTRLLSVKVGPCGCVG